MYLFLKRGEGKEKERERSINLWLPLKHPLLGTWPATQVCDLTGNRTGNPLVHRHMLNPLSYTSPGDLFYFFKKILFHFCSDLNYFLPSTYYDRFACSSSSSFRCRVKIVYLKFFTYRGQPAWL